MTRLTALALLGLATLGVAEPIPIANRRANGDGKNDDLHSVKEVCTSHNDLSTFKNAKEAWIETGAGVWMDLQIKNVWTSSNWLNRAAEEVFPNKGPSGLDGCAVIGGTCSPELDCETFVKKDFPLAFWVFRAVKGMHDKMNYFHEKLQDTAIIEGLQISSINDDFSADLTGRKDFMSYLIAALGMASSTVGLEAPLLGAGFGVLGSGVLAASTSLGPDNAPPAEDEMAMKDWLSKAFSSISKNIGKNMRMALTGKGGDLDKLPKGDQDLQTPQARFFSNGFWLVDSFSDVFKDAMDKMQANFHEKLVDIALQGDIGVLLIGDTEVGSKEDCKAMGDNNYWLKSKGDHYCFYLVKSREPRKGDCPPDDPWDCLGNSFDGVDDGIYANLKKHGINIKSYYEHLIDCSLYGSGKIGDTISLDGLVPRCYFNLPARRTAWGGAYDRYSLIDKSW